VPGKKTVSLFFGSLCVAYAPVIVDQHCSVSVVLVVDRLPAALRLTGRSSEGVPLKDALVSLFYDTPSTTGSTKVEAQATSDESGFVSFLLDPYARISQVRRVEIRHGGLNWSLSAVELSWFGVLSIQLPEEYGGQAKVIGPSGEVVLILTEQPPTSEASLKKEPSSKHRNRKATVTEEGPGSRQAVVASGSTSKPPPSPPPLAREDASSSKSGGRKEVGADLSHLKSSRKSSRKFANLNIEEEEKDPEPVTSPFALVNLLPSSLSPKKDPLLGLLTSPSPEKEAEVQEASETPTSATMRRSSPDRRYSMSRHNRLSYTSLPGDSPQQQQLPLEESSPSSSSSLPEFRLDIGVFFVKAKRVSPGAERSCVTIG